MTNEIVLLNYYPENQTFRIDGIRQLSSDIHSFGINIARVSGNYAIVWSDKGSEILMLNDLDTFKDSKNQDFYSSRNGIVFVAEISEGKIAVAFVGNQLSIIDLSDLVSRGSLQQKNQNPGEKYDLAVSRVIDNPKRAEYSIGSLKHTAMVNENYVKDSIAGAFWDKRESENMKGTLHCSFSGKKAYGNGFSASKIIEARNSTEDPWINPYNPN